MKNKRAISVFGTDKTVSFILEKSFGYEPIFRTRHGNGNGNVHITIPSCPTLALAVAAIRKAARHEPSDNMFSE